VSARRPERSPPERPNHRHRGHTGWRGGASWLVGRDGGIFTFGDALFYGSTGDLTLNKPIVGIASAPRGTGCWLVASDEGIFNFGTAHVLGSAGSLRLNRPNVGITADPAGRGYRLVASDGGIFTFGKAPFYLGLEASWRWIVNA